MHSHAGKDAPVSVRGFMTQEGKASSLQPHLTCNILSRAGACWPVSSLWFWLLGCLPWSLLLQYRGEASWKGGFEVGLADGAARCSEVWGQCSSDGWGAASSQWCPFYCFQCRIQMATTWFWLRPRGALLQGGRGCCQFGSPEDCPSSQCFTRLHRKSQTVMCPSPGGKQPPGSHFFLLSSNGC